MPSETGPKGPAAAAEKLPAAGPNPYAGWCEAQLKFKLPLNYRAVDQLITKAGEAMQLTPEPDRDFHLSNPKYVEGDLTAFAEWDVKIMLPHGESQGPIEQTPATGSR